RLVSCAVPHFRSSRCRPILKGRVEALALALVARVAWASLGAGAAAAEPVAETSDTVAAARGVEIGHGDTSPPSISLFSGRRRQIHVPVPRVDHGPTLDGRLDDAVWRRAAVLDSFTQGVPIEGVPDSLGTQCLVLYDAQNLYVGFRCTDDPRSVQSPVTPRDNSWQGDYVCVNIDGFGDHQRSQFFCASAAGI